MGTRVRTVVVWCGRCERLLEPGDEIGAITHPSGVQRYGVSESCVSCECDDAELRHNVA